LLLGSQSNVGQSQADGFTGRHASSVHFQLRSLEYNDLLIDFNTHVGGLT